MSTLEIRPLNSSLEIIAVEQLFEDPDKILENLEAFREWIKKSPHLKARSDDQFLVTFLRGCKYSLEKAKQKLDMFYTLRTHLPELMVDRDPLSTRIQQIMKLGVSIPLPDTETPGSPRLLLFRPGAYDAAKFSIQEVMKLSVMMNDILMIEDDNMVVSGQTTVVDLAHVTFGHLMQMQPAFIKKATMLMQEATPIRQKGIHYINAPNGFEQLFNLIKSFMSEKMQKRIFVHSTLDSLYEVVPRRLMPTDYEGECGSLESLKEVWEKKIVSYRDYFLEESTKYGVDEKKRLGRPKNADSIFGIDGTFRQLQFD